MSMDGNKHTRHEYNFSCDEEMELLDVIESFFQQRGFNTPVFYEELKLTFHVLDEMILVLILIDLVTEGKIIEPEPGIFLYNVK